MNKYYISIFWILGAMLLFSVQDVLTKIFSSYMSLFQIYFLRSIFGLFILSLFLKIIGHPITFLKTAYPFLSIVRVTFWFLSYGAFYVSLSLMPIANAVTLFFVSPIFINLFSMYFYGDKIRISKWLAIVIGFVGVYFVSNANFDNSSVFIFLPVLSAAIYALCILITKHTSGRDSVYQQMTHFYIGAFIFGGFMSLLLWNGQFEISGNIGLSFLTRPWGIINFIDLLYLFLLAFITTASFLMLLMAYRTSTPSKIAPFEYTNIIWAIFMGYLIWGDKLSFQNVFGIILITSCGIYLLINEADQNFKEKKVEH